MRKLAIACGAVAAAVWGAVALRPAAPKPLPGSDPSRRVETIKQYDQLTRPDVPKWRALVLDAESLRTLSDEKTDLNVTVFLQQPDAGADVLTASSWGSGSTARLHTYRLGSDNRLERISDTAVEPRPGPHYEMVEVDQQKNGWELRRDGKPILPLQWTMTGHHSSGPPTRVLTFNGGRSLLLGGSDCFVVPDAEKPELVQVPLTGPGDAFVFSADGRQIFGIGQERADQWLYRVSSDGAATRSELSLSRVEKLRWSPAGELMVVEENDLLLIDPKTLGQIGRFALPAGAYPYRGLAARPDGPVLVTGCSLVNLKTHATHTLDGCIPAGELTVTDEVIYYVGPRSGLDWTRLHRFDLRSMTETAVRDFDPPVGTARGLDFAIRAVYPVSGGRLLALAGTQVGYFDHDHVLEQ